jgi:polyphosphate kinase 2 (PPK2 family)
MAKGKTHQHESGSAAGPQAQDAESLHQVPLHNKLYRSELAGLQVEMLKLQQWASGDGRHPIVILLEGLGPAGKRRTGEAIVEGLHKKVGQLVTLDPPGKRERGQWIFQRYVEHFPGAGKIVVFDGSWYHFPAEERALGICSEPDFEEFLRRCAAFEKTLTDSGLKLIKYWFTAEEAEQERRFRAHIADLQKHKQFYLPEIVQNCEPLSVASIQAAVLASTDRPASPWYVVRSDDKRRARLNCMKHLLSLVPDDNPAEGMTPPEPEFPQEQTAVRLVPEAF